MKKTALIKELIILTLATSIISASVFFFMMPSHASISSIAGLAIVLANFVLLSVSMITIIINVFLLIIGFITCGREFVYKTVYTSLLMPVIIGVFEKLFPNYESMTGDVILDVACYIFFVSIGIAILFNRNASSGGLDIVAKIMNKYLRIDLRKAMSIAGLCIAGTSILAYDTKILMLSILGTYFNGIIVDHFIFDQKLMAFVDKLDPHAFVTVYMVSEMQYRSKALPEREFE